MQRHIVYFKIIVQSKLLLEGWYINQTHIKSGGSTSSILQVNLKCCQAPLIHLSLLEQVIITIKLRQMEKNISYIWIIPQPGQPVYLQDENNESK